MLIFFNGAKKAPWADKVSIYSYIQAQVEEQGKLVDYSLPDDEEFWQGSKVRWVAGGIDGAFGHHSSSTKSLTEELRELVKLLAKQTRKPSQSKRKAIYEKLIKQEISGVIDAVLDELRKQPSVQPSQLFHEGKWFAEHAAHRNVVKFGIAILGLFENEQVKELLHTLGRHDEFTLYSAVAIRNGMEEGSNQAIFELAKHVDGWGKIQLVERLEPNTQEIKDWLLRKGSQNSVMNEYLACICARNGKLHEALQVDFVDNELFEGATDIIQALLHGGPAEDINDYEQAPQVIFNYLRLASTMCQTLKHLSVISEIYGFLRQSDIAWEQRFSNGWTKQMRDQYAATCRTLISQSRWSAMILEKAISSDSSDRYYAALCAKQLEVDIWDLQYSQLPTNPMELSIYLELMKSQDSDRIMKVVQFGENHLPLQQIATGPEDEMGFGPKYTPHQILGTILRSLDCYEGTGRELIITGLNSPVISNRNTALQVLEAWDKDLWGDNVIQALKQLSRSEPTDSIQERLQKLIGII